MNMKHRTIKSVVNKRYSQDCFVNFTNGESEIIAMDLALKYNLSPKKELSELDLNEILSENRKIKVKQIAYKYANYKPRTAKQVNERLKQKGFSESEIGSALKFLKEFGLINDKKYAENFIKELLNKKPSGRSAMISELKKKGISKELAELSISRFFPFEDLPDLAMQAAEKKMRIIRHKPKEKQKQALITYLQRRGFVWETIKSILPNFFPDDE